MPLEFIRNNDLSDPDGIDALLELASFVRTLIGSGRYEDIVILIRSIVENGYYEAFSWTMAALQEEYEKADCTAASFECGVGRSIPDYDEFIKRLRVDLNQCRNSFEKVTDNNGEVESFFNILTYETGYKNIYLVSSENFDTKDNDYVQYKLSFVSKAGL